jgi:hypothetical protein
MGNKLTREQLLEAMRIMGARGGNARAKNNSPEQLREWASLGAKFGKLGGRPKGSKNKPKKGKS